MNLYKNNLNTYDLQSIHGYIYKITLPDGRVYIGQKKGNHIIETYWGSSKHVDNWFKKNIGFPSKNCPNELAEMHGVTREILDYALTRLELNLLEMFYIDEFKYIYGEDCLNIHPGGIEPVIKNENSKFILSEESRRKARETKRMKAEMGMYKISDETKRKMSDGIKKARKLKPVWNKGLTKDSDNRVKELYENRKLSENGRKKLQENGRRTSKSMWYNNGHTQIRVFDGEMPPSGFVRGMLKRKK